MHISPVGEKGFIFMLERVNLPKTGDICIYMGEKGFIFMLDITSFGEVYPLQHENEAFFSHINAYISSFGEVYPLLWEKKASFSCWRG
jgi:hypothetical protein